jgi:hypothetical protein
MGAPAVTIERFAALRAEMEAGALRDEVLRREGLEPEVWIDAQRTWLAKMGDELDRGRFELTNRYGAAFMGNLPAAAGDPAAQEPDAAPPVTDPMPAALGGDLPGSPLPFQGGPEVRAEGAMPSYLRAESAEPATPPRTRASVDITADALPAIGAEDALPFVKPDPALQMQPAGGAGGNADAKAPPVSAPVDTPPMLTVEQYASLTIDLLLEPGRARETLRRYHLTQAQKELLDAGWQARFAANPAAKTGFDAACSAYRAWKLQNRR